MSGRVSGEWRFLEGEGEVADDRVVEAFGAVVVEADVVGGPAGAELVAAGGELADEVVRLRPPASARRGREPRGSDHVVAGSPLAVTTWRSR
jgi:hypothetical protein